MLWARWGIRYSGTRPSAIEIQTSHDALICQRFGFRRSVLKRLYNFITTPKSCAFLVSSTRKIIVFRV